MQLPDNDDLLKKIKSLERRLKKIERDSRIGLEDQLFFGLVVSITLLLISVRSTELATLFEYLWKLPIETALSMAEQIRNFGIVSLVSASILRYYGAVKPHKGARLASFECLIGSFNFFLFIFVPRLLSNVLVIFELLSFQLALFGLFLVYLTMGLFVEGKILRFYKEKKLIPKKYTEPFVSLLFSFMVFGTMVALAVGVILILLNVPVPEFLLFGAYFFSTGVLLVLYIYRLKRKKII